MGPSADDIRIRMAAFQWLEAQEKTHGESLPRALLAEGFPFEGERVRLLGPQGIFKPQRMQLPLSITTTSNGPYDDGFRGDDVLYYRYRGTDPSHRDNVGLREAMCLGVPLVYFHGFVPGRYAAEWPVFIVNDDPATLTFSVQVDARPEIASRLRLAEGAGRRDGSLADDPGTEARRAYITAEVRVRLHQRGFRERVLRAYQEQCALCHLRHEELLDAAHIIPDGEPDSEPIVPNGIALCKLHHAAFDSYFFGIRPDCTVEVSEEIMREEDGPMLRHGLQGIHNQLIHRPSSPSLRPDPALLERRYERFRHGPSGGLR
ncbi:MAG: HNH endonuclease signature motif containing protein [Thermoanaerobaculaceae bacterium]|jgi:putative restriction endonuclease